VQRRGIFEILVIFEFKTGKALAFLIKLIIFLFILLLNWNIFIILFLLPLLFLFIFIIITTFVPFACVCIPIGTQIGTKAQGGLQDRWIFILHFCLPLLPSLLCNSKLI